MSPAVPRRDHRSKAHDLSYCGDTMIRAALDKNTVEESAERLVRRGHYDRALQELQRLVDSQRADGHVFLKMADVHRKKGDNRSAADCLRRAAEAYSSSGFPEKAQAIQNQSLKLQG
jgi:pilus assembly protein FimV